MNFIVLTFVALLPVSSALHIKINNKPSSWSSQCRLPRIENIEFWCRSSSTTRYRLCREAEPSGTMALPKCLSQDGIAANWTLPVMACVQSTWDYIPECNPVCYHEKLRQRGACVKLRQCPSAFEEYRKLEQPQICPHEGNVPRVCCPTARTLNQMLLVHFGFNNTLFAHFNGSWYPRSSLPETLLRPSVSRAPGRGMILVGARSNNVTEVPQSYFYDLIDDVWTSGPPLATARIDYCSVTFRNIVYVFGGYNKINGYSILNTVEYLDLNEGLSVKWNSLRSSMQQSRKSAAAVAWRGELYITGGKGVVTYRNSGDQMKVLSSVEKYNVKVKRWELLHHTMSTPRMNHRIVVFEDIIYVIGGKNKNNYILTSCELFDGNEWKSISSLNVAREKPAVGVFDGQLYVVGGSNEYSQSLEIYDPILKWWTFIKDAAGPISVLDVNSAIVLDTPHTMWNNNSQSVFTSKLWNTFYHHQNEMLLMVGGWRYETIGAGDISVSNTTVGLVNGSYVVKADYPGEVWDVSVTQRPAGKVVATGGEVEGGVLNTTYIYDVAEDRWTSGPSMNTPRRSHSSVTVGTKVYVIGGFDLHGNRQTSVEVWDWSLGESSKWEYVSPMGTDRDEAAAVVYKGDIYVTGGVPRVRSGEKYIVGNDTWVPIPDMVHNRNAHGLVTFGNKIFAIGGFGDDKDHKSVELFDGVQWVEETSLNVGRGGVACGVIGGRIYVVGGYEFDVGLVRSMEIKTQLTGKLDSGMRGPYRVLRALPHGRYELQLLAGSYGKLTQAAAEYMVPWRGEWTPEVCAAYFEGEFAVWE